MSFPTDEKQRMPVVTPCQTMECHTDRIKSVVHLPEGRRIITCSLDGSLRLWDLEGNAQIGEYWQDEKEKKAGVYEMALSPNGKTVVSGSEDGKVRLWDVDTGKVITKWTGHSGGVMSVCWSVDGNRVLSGGYSDRTARVWDVEAGETILKINTRHVYVWVVIYSPDNIQIATGGFNPNAAKIWDARTGRLLATLKHDWTVWSLAWTSDGDKLISASYGPIRIFNTATWQEIAILEGHTTWVSGISLSQNDRLLATASDDKTSHLWNLDSNLQIGPPLRHKDQVECAAFSTDGKVLVTGCNDKNAYMWDIHDILKQAGLEDLLPTDTNIAPKDQPETSRTPRSSISDKSFLEADATRCHDESGGVDELPPRFFDGMEANDDSPPMGGAHPHSSASAFLARLALLLHRFRPDDAEANERPQPPTLSGSHLRVLFARLASLIHHSPPENDAQNELQQPSTSSRLDLHALLARLSSFLPRSRLNTDEESEPHPTTPSGSRPDAFMDLLSSLFRSQPRTSEEFELSQRPMHAYVVEVAAVRDREVLFVAPRPPPHPPNTQPAGNTVPGAKPAHSLPVRLLAHLVLFLCCASPQHPDGNAHSTQQQQQGQPQGPVQAQALSPQTQPTAPLVSTSAVPTTPDICITLTCAATT
ncbi:WD40-repeat-containing domain protein [Suillus americanus]|nr:WD40-repeat-containing domain protein [Suillus americanus]